MAWKILLMDSLMNAVWPLIIDPEEERMRDTERRMLSLTASFPTLRGVLDVWDPDYLDRWACGPEPGSGAFHACRFVLSVWNPGADWKAGRFDLHPALWVWDAEHRAAFVAWARTPWWP
jgi:hypothetical protein